jgi:hypothetical protein
MSLRPHSDLPVLWSREYTSVRGGTGWIRAWSGQFSSFDLTLCRSRLACLQSHRINSSPTSLNLPQPLFYISPRHEAQVLLLPLNPLLTRHHVRSRLRLARHRRRSRRLQLPNSGETASLPHSAHATIQSFELSSCVPDVLGDLLDCSPQRQYHHRFVSFLV